MKNIFGYLRKELTHFAHSREASIVPITAIMFPLLFGIVGLGIDVSAWMMDKRNLQTAADAGAIAGAYEAFNGMRDNVDYAALNEAQQNGFRANSDNSLIDVSFIQTEGTDIGLSVQVTLKHSSYPWFSSLLHSKSPYVAATAQAAVIQPGDGTCLLSLDPDARGSLTIQGTAEIDAPHCGIVTNSTDDQSLLISGNSNINIGDVTLAGDYDIIGNSAEFNHDSLRSNAQPVEDPYADLEIPAHDPCTETYSYNGSDYELVENPDGIRVLCGINITGTNDVEFEPGVYIIEGDDFSVAGGGSLTADGVTFILTGSGNDYSYLDITGNRDVYFNAPAPGEYFEGIVFFQDPDTPYRVNLSSRLTGTSNVTLNGVAYFPNGHFEFGGNNDSDTPTCSQVVARTIELSGTPNLDSSCDDVAVGSIDPPRVMLVL